MAPLPVPRYSSGSGAHRFRRGEYNSQRGEGSGIKKNILTDRKSRSTLHFPARANLGVKDQKRRVGQRTSGSGTLGAPHLHEGLTLHDNHPLLGGRTYAHAARPLTGRTPPEATRTQPPKGSLRNDLMQESGEGGASAAPLRLSPPLFLPESHWLLAARRENREPRLRHNWTTLLPLDRRPARDWPSNPWFESQSRPGRICQSATLGRAAA